MNSVVGLFPTREAAEKAAGSLMLPGDRVSVVAPGPLKPEDAGIGPALAGAVGAALGAAAGAALGPAASLALPLLMGATGAALGAAAGEKIESAATPDPGHDPRDLFYYHAALRRGRAIVLALAETSQEADSIRSKLVAAGAGTLDMAREDWWQDVREDERAAYQGNFAEDEEDYRRGFEAALEPANRGKELTDGPELSKAYQMGYRRGYEYLARAS